MLAANQSNLPDYEQLVKFLFQPFLSTTELIGVDCEYTLERHRVWIRVAIATGDRVSAFGRGGRNIQAIRTVLQAVATIVGQSIYLDVYGSNASTRDRDMDRSGREESSTTPARSIGSRPTTRSAPNRRSSANGDDRSSRGDSPSVPPPRPRR